MLLLTSEEYVHDLIDEIKKNPVSIKIICFRILADAMMAKIEPALVDALHSGTTVQIYTDAIYTKYNPGRKHYNSPFDSKLRKEVTVKRTKTLLLFNRLKAAGAEIKFVNEPNFINYYLVPFFGRDHRKIVIIKSQDNVSYFGGVNIDEGGYNDFMVKVTDAKVIEAIDAASTIIDNSGAGKDTQYKASESVEVLLDVGKPFQSKIYETGMSMIREAKKNIIFVSQLPPELPLLLELLKAAQRGVAVEVVLPDTSFPTISTFPYNTAYNLFRMQAKQNKIQIHHCSKGFTHAKVLLCDNSCLVGSHNLSYIGVVAGTIELSCKISNLEFIKQLEFFIDSIK